MSAASCLLSEDQFLCSICLDVFTDPVTTSCGHNFCKNCITKHWTINVQWMCPLCKTSFSSRPELRTNTFISGMVSQFRQNLKPMARRRSKEQYESRKAEMQATNQQMIDERLSKIDEIKKSVNLSNQNAEEAIAEGVRVFTALTESVEIGLNDLIKTIEERQQTTKQQAEDLIKELEKEVSDLKKRNPSVERFPSNNNWTEVGVCPRTYEGTVMRAAIQLVETLSGEIKSLVEVELQMVQQYAVEVTLDPKTSHPSLILSDDGKQVNPGDVKKNLPDNPERFSLNPCVLGKQSFSSGRFYYEALVKGKTNWDLGVARESINRKEDIPLSPEDGYWTIWLRKRNKYKALNATPVSLSLKSQPEKIGVFVDYEEGLVSFYDVDAPALLYSFTDCNFTGKLLPYFNPGLSAAGKNSAPLVIVS